MTDAAYKILAVMLKKQNIQFQIVIVDVDRMMDEENEVQIRGMSFSFYSRYHPLEEVTRVFADLAVRKEIFVSDGFL